MLFSDPVNNLMTFVEDFLGSSGDLVLGLLTTLFRERKVASHNLRHSSREVQSISIALVWGTLSFITLLLIRYLSIVVRCGDWNSNSLFA